MAQLRRHRARVQHQTGYGLVGLGIGIGLAALGLIDASALSGPASLQALLAPMGVTLLCAVVVAWVMTAPRAA